MISTLQLHKNYVQYTLLLQLVVHAKDYAWWGNGGHNALSALLVHHPTTLPHMKNQAVKGSRSIAIVSSQAGLVGIYGYTASKFGIQGMAESLQQEVIGYDIHVSLIFPSDTDTPGMAIERKRRPEITSIIAASSSAKISLDGIRSGRFLVRCNLEAFALCIVTAGMSPQRSVLKAFIEVTCAGLTRIAALCFLLTMLTATKLLSCVLAAQLIY
ncbi:reductase [Lithospermum erythrorhizon]|uniref:Reductase n=1 Tax=Lithospermum erythrorhizon TaxID=34254 RepID=A0AAV3RPU6_LITER